MSTQTNTTHHGAQLRHVTNGNLDAGLDAVDAEGGHAGVQCVVEDDRPRPGTDVDDPLDDESVRRGDRMRPLDQGVALARLDRAVHGALPSNLPAAVQPERWLADAFPENTAIRSAFNNDAIVLLVILLPLDVPLVLALARAPVGLSMSRSRAGGLHRRLHLLVLVHHLPAVLVLLFPVALVLALARTLDGLSGRRSGGVHRRLLLLVHRLGQRLVVVVVDVVAAVAIDDSFVVTHASATQRNVLRQSVHDS